MATSSSCEWSIVKRNGQLVAKRKLPKHTRARRSSNQIKSIVFPFFCSGHFQRESHGSFQSRVARGHEEGGGRGSDRMVRYSDVYASLYSAFFAQRLYNLCYAAAAASQSHTYLLACCAFSCFCHEPVTAGHTRRMYLRQ